MKNKMNLLLVLFSVNSSLASFSPAVVANQEDEKPLVGVPIQQKQLKELVSQAITQFEQTPLNDWSYRLIRYENEEGDVTSSIEQFTPNLERVGQWSLLEINGAKPTEKQTRKFVDSKTQKHKGNIGLELRQLILLDSLQYYSESERNLQVRFNVHLSKLGTKASKQLQGVLTINQPQQFIETIEITNIAHFSPVFSAKINDFKLTLSFLKIDDAILPRQQILTMKGSFAFFTEIDEKSTDTYSNYQYLGQLEPAK